MSKTERDLDVKRVDPVTNPDVYKTLTETVKGEDGTVIYDSTVESGSGAWVASTLSIGVPR